MRRFSSLLKSANCRPTCRRASAIGWIAPISWCWLREWQFSLRRFSGGHRPRAFLEVLRQFHYIDPTGLNLFETHRLLEILKYHEQREGWCSSFIFGNSLWDRNITERGRSMKHTVYLIVAMALVVYFVLAVLQKVPRLRTRWCVTDGLLKWQRSKATQMKIYDGRAIRSSA